MNRPDEMDYSQKLQELQDFASKVSSESEKELAVINLGMTPKPKV